MAVLTWDGSGEKKYETGVDHGVLYVINSSGAYPQGVAWNGLISVSDSPSGAESTSLYADNIEYGNLISVEDYGGTIECYTYPSEFGQCNGEASLATGAIIGQQSRKKFGFVYRTKVGNDVDGDDHGYKLHLIYGCTAKPSEVQYETVNDSPNAITFSFEFETTPVPVTGFKPTAHIVIDSKTANAANLATLEGKLFGTSNAAAYLPLPDEVKSTLNAT